MWHISMFKIQYENSKKKKTAHSAQLLTQFDQHTHTLRLHLQDSKSFNILWKKLFILSTTAHIVVLIHSMNYNSNLSADSHLYDSCSRVTTGCYDTTSEL